LSSTIEALFMRIGVLAAHNTWLTTNWKRTSKDRCFARCDLALPFEQLGRQS